MLWRCCRSHMRRLNFFNSIFFLFKRVTGLFFSEIRYIFHGEGVILTANYRTVEVTCRLVLIRLLKSSVSLKKCCRAQGSQTYKSLCCPELASTCQQRLITWCAVWMLRRWGRRLGISSSPYPHLDSTLKKAPVCFSTETLGVRKWIGSGFSVLTATSRSTDLDLCLWAFWRWSNASAPFTNYGMRCTPVTCFLDA